MKNVGIFALGGFGQNIIKELVKQDIYHPIVVADKKKDQRKNEDVLFYDSEGQRSEILQHVENKEMILLLSGLGGNASEELLPQLIREANEKEIPVVGLFVTPFKWEGGRRDFGLALADMFEPELNVMGIVRNEDLPQYIKNTGKKHSATDTFGVIDDYFLQMVEAILKEDMYNQEKIQRIVTLHTNEFTLKAQ